MSSDEIKALEKAVEEQGQVVRQLKTDKAPKPEIEAAVKELLSRKAALQAAGGVVAAPAGGRDKKDKKKAQDKGDKGDKGKKQQQQAGGKAKKASSTANTQGLAFKKAENFAMWYSDLVKKAELIEYYDISGCYILRPAAYSMWEVAQRFFDEEIKKLGVRNCYFPLFVSEAALTREKDHVAGFAPEVAWVTRAGQSELKEPIAVRPTSETIMYPAYAKWIRSHRDLPLKLNQWSNVVRWEFKYPTPFIRSREFLWQEGHTAFETKEEADHEVMQILDLYARVYEDILCVPVMKGKKTEKEKFAGGLYTTTVEAFVPSTGRGIQGGTSHCLGQNFSKMFKIVFEDKNGQKQFAWQNSWGLTTRTIGVMLMVHADDKGLVLPPRIASTHVVIVPLGKKEQLRATTEAGEQLAATLRAVGVTATVDTRDKNSGWKFNDLELHGVPLRVELGSRELESGRLKVVQRFQEKVHEVSTADLPQWTLHTLAKIQRDMLAVAKQEFNDRMISCSTWAEFTAALDRRCMVLAPWCESIDCETKIKEESAKAASTVEAADDDQPVDSTAEKLTGAAKSLCVPFDQPAMKAGTKCAHCGNEARVYCLFGRSY